MNNTKVKQLHKHPCKELLPTEESLVDFDHKSNEQKCTCTLDFPIKLLEEAIKNKEPTAWRQAGKLLESWDKPYVAISHVWADGTGVGVGKPHTANGCLFDYFMDIAKHDDVRCEAVW
jgi:hypothetical protein